MKAIIHACNIQEIDYLTQVAESGTTNKCNNIRYNTHIVSAYCGRG